MAWIRFAAIAAVFFTGCVPFVGSPKWESRDFPPVKSAKGVQYGEASWYGDKEHGNKAASGERFSRYAYTAAHKELPFGTVVQVTNLKNGKQVTVRINDRGPFIGERVIDLSYAAAKSIGLIRDGVAKVRIEVISTPSGRSESLFVSLYTVQAGSFGSRTKAYELRQRLSRVTDEIVRVEPFSFDGVTYHRVRIGRFERKKDAEELRSTLKKLGYITSIYVE